MGTLTAKARKKLPKGDFALPGNKKKGIPPKYPINDRAHAINAKSRAAQQKKAGNLTPGEYTTIIAKADRFLKKKSGGAKKKGNESSHAGGLAHGPAHAVRGGDNPLRGIVQSREGDVNLKQNISGVPELESASGPTPADLPRMKDTAPWMMPNLPGGYGSPDQPKPTNAYKGKTLV